MRRVVSLVMVASLSVPASTLFAAPAVKPLAQSAGSIAGKALNSNGRMMSNTSVRLRSLADGQLSGTTTTDAVGQFSFASLPAGNYTIEVVNAAGNIVGTSAPISLGAGASVTGVTVMSSAIAAAAAGAGATGSFIASTAGLITVAAAGAAVAAVTVAATRQTASPSQ